MMHWIVIAAAATASSVFILTLVNVYLHHRHRDGFLKLWAIAWGIQTFRYLCLIASNFWPANLILQAAYYLIIITSAVVLLIGTRAFIGKPTPKWLPISGAIVSLWTVFAIFHGMPFMAVVVPAFAFSSVTYIHLGSQIIKKARPGALASRLVGTLFIIWGLHQADYPVLRPIEWFAPWGFLMGSALATAIALGMVLIYFEKTLRTLNEKESFHRNLIESSHDLIWEMDADGVYTYVSPLIEDLLGYTPEEVIGKTPFDLMPEAETAGIRKIVTDISSRRLPFHSLEKINLHKNGGTVIVETSGVPFFDAGGTYLGYRGMDLNITERKQAENSSRESQTKLEAAMASMTDAVSISDAYGHFIEVNDAFASFHRFENKAACFKRREEYQDVFDFSALSGEQVPKEMWPVSRALQGETVSSIEYTLCRKDTAESWFGSFSFSPIRDKHGTIVGSVVVARDITELKRNEEARLKLKAQLQQAQKMEAIGQLAGGVAHDFNNMLSVILGHTEMAMEGMEKTHPLFADLKEINNAAQRSAGITRQLLSFARKQTIITEVINLNVTVEGMLKMLTRLIGEGIGLIWEPGVDLWSVMIDPSQIDQILVNLCVNARDAIAGVGTIIVKTRNMTLTDKDSQQAPYLVAGDYVMLAVSDTGCGMSMETQNHIFEPFFTTKGIGEGTGMGLATIYGVVKQNKGFITVFSEPGQGATFKIYIPRHLSSAEQGNREEVRRPEGDKDETILLVEDEPTLIKMTTSMLQRLGYSVVAAATPREAINAVNTFGNEIHLLITDVIMPEMNGKELAEKLLTIQPNMKCLFISGYTADIISKQGVLQEGVHFLKKPFSKRELAANVQVALGVKVKIEPQ
ncbi:MAG: PAS domain S-box protein [Desulfocapsaceae bacterium]|nr:PAS domain S-box protein [Desulfocapsaceae bacterium]